MLNLISLSSIVKVYGRFDNFIYFNSRPFVELCD